MTEQIRIKLINIGAFSMNSLIPHSRTSENTNITSSPQQGASTLPGTTYQPSLIGLS
ncbi:hypothetical protein O9992_27205 [Vibrio lentus]|nr:hypothetical protein [Vibrio lentus]